MYSLDWNKIVQWSLPAWARLERLVRWLLSCVSPLKTLHSNFEKHVEATETELKVNGQVRKLTFWLNEIYDPAQRGITLVEQPMSNSVFIFTENENQPLYLPAFIGGREIDFRVRVPDDIPNRDRITAFVQKHKLPSTTFNLLLYNRPIS